MISSFSFPSRRTTDHHHSARMPADSIFANLTFRSEVRPLTLLHERHDALSSSHQGASCQSCQPALPGTTEPYLLELELQVARSYSSYCLLHAYLLALKSMVRTLPFLVGSQETQAARAAQQSPSDPTGGDGRERRDASQEGKRGPANAHATARHVFFAHLGKSSLQGSKTAAAGAAAGGRGRDGLTG